MSRRHFHDSYRDKRYRTHHYKEETVEGVFEAKVESALSSLLQAVKKIFRKVIR